MSELIEVGYVDEVDHALVAEVTSFLTREADLLDSWLLLDWLVLLTDDIQYLVPPLDIPTGAVGEILFMIADDRVRVESRVRQLLGKSVWSEMPRSRTRRLLTNIHATADGDEILALANFAVWQFQQGETDTFVGKARYRLVREGQRLRIRERRMMLDMEYLRPHGKISFIL
jgi:p-cumate 2,3-dioxygenase beta subunit